MRDLERRLRGGTAGRRWTEWRASQEPTPSGYSERGSITAFVALLVVPLFALLGLVVDGGNAISAQQAAAVEAEQAARAGAGALSVAGLRSGVVALAGQRAVADAVAATVAAGHPGSAVVSGGTVTVHVAYRIPTVILGIVGISSLPVEATATAVDLAGVTEGTP